MNLPLPVTGRGAKRKKGIKAVTAEEKRAVFINEYLVDGNGKRSAIKAGYSENGAEVTASKLLRHPKVKVALDARKAELAKTYGLDLGKYLKIWDQIATADIRRVFDDKGALLPPLLWPDEVAATIESLEVVEMGKGAEGAPIPMYSKKVKAWSKIAALEKLTDMASGVHGKPTTAIQVNIYDRSALTETHLDKLFGRYVPGG